MSSASATAKSLAHGLFLDMWGSCETTKTQEAQKLAERLALQILNPNDASIPIEAKREVANCTKALWLNAPLSIMEAADKLMENKD